MHTVRGYACVFGCVGAMSTGDHFVLPGAFIQSSALPVGVRFGSHEAPDLVRSSTGAVKLFQDDYGLGFEALLPNTRAADWAVRAIDSGRLTGCSVQFERVVEGPAVRSICSVAVARISHIAVIRNPAFLDTAAWSAKTPVGKLPARIRHLAEHWTNSYYRSIEEPGCLVRSCLPRTAQIPSTASRASALPRPSYGAPTTLKVRYYAMNNDQYSRALDVHPFADIGLPPLLARRVA